MEARLLGAMAATLLLANAASAQIGGLGSASLPSRTEISPAPPENQILSRPTETRDLFRAPLDVYTPGRPIPQAGFWVPWYQPFYDAPYDHRRSSFKEFRRHGRGTAPLALARGYLRLQVRPPTAHVYVDGAYIGSVEDLSRLIPGRSLEAGAHRVEVRLAGYETLSFEVRIEPNETVTYRDELQRLESTPKSPAAAPAVPRSFYVIPGCYAGDRHPRTLQLPSACNTANVRTIPPVLGFATRPR